jgi:hypothetical protein
MRTRVSIATVVVSLTVALSSASASASSEPKLAGTCPGNPFFGIYALHDISLDRACQVGVPTRAAGVIRCVNEPHGQFPISRLEIQRYRGYALSEDSPWASVSSEATSASSSPFNAAKPATKHKST